MQILFIASLLVYVKKPSLQDHAFCASIL